MQQARFLNGEGEEVAAVRCFGDAVRERLVFLEVSPGKPAEKLDVWCRLEEAEQKALAQARAVQFDLVDTGSVGDFGSEGVLEFSFDPGITKEDLAEGLTALVELWTYWLTVAAAVALALQGGVCMFWIYSSFDRARAPVLSRVCSYALRALPYSVFMFSVFLIVGGTCLLSLDPRKGWLSVAVGVLLVLFAMRSIERKQGLDVVFMAFVPIVLSLLQLYYL